MYRPVEPDQTDVTRAWIDDAMARMEGPGPGRVQAYDPATQTADVVPLLRLPVPQGDGSNSFEDGPVVPHVPVVFPRAAGFVIAFPVAPGDYVLLIPCGGDVGTWFAGNGGVTTPTDLRRHHLAHAVAIPGLFPRGQALAHPSSNLHVGNDTAAPDGGTLEIATDGTVTLNGGTLAVARHSDAVQVTIPAGSLSLAVVGGGGGTATGPATDLVLMGTITGPCAPKVKA